MSSNNEMSCEPWEFAEIAAKKVNLKTKPGAVAMIKKNAYNVNKGGERAIIIGKEVFVKIDFLWVPHFHLLVTLFHR